MIGFTDVLGRSIYLDESSIKGVLQVIPEGDLWTILCYGGETYNCTGEYADKILQFMRLISDVHEHLSSNEESEDDDEELPTQNWRDN
jgi:hypothetical protein